MARTLRRPWTRCWSCTAARTRRRWIELRDTPAALYQLLVLANLLSAWIGAPVAAASARAVDAGFRTPEKMRGVLRQRVTAGPWRIQAVRRAHLHHAGRRRGPDPDMGGDLSTADASDDASGTPGGCRISRHRPPTGASIFAREAQGVWPALALHVDKKALACSPRRPAGGRRRAGGPRGPRSSCPSWPPHWCQWPDRTKGYLLG
ncbi:hypothetical protein QJS66_21505 [Kocuria rhizophila]|nr:hypothetical protein QJS66_21505 [Kocuria rhizophila]